MIGWLFVVAQQTPEARDNAVDPKASVLATRETAVSGIDWLHDLVKEGKATRLRFDGYPNRFVALASAVLPLIVDGPPKHSGPEVIGDDYVMSGDWTGKVNLNREKIAACPTDQILTIDVWDQS